MHPPTGQCIASSVRLANTFLTRLRGLMFSRRLAPGEGLWLRPCQGVHTFWMFFTIDVIFLDRELRIVRLVENLRPFRATKPHLAAWSVLEVRPGTIAECGLKIGEQLAVEG
ncbi:MAG: hypothetical protein RIR52_970 [Acidobacteriota bacterium]|jgi:uncharacterized membrane protein (UPF0127 family)